MRGKPILRLAAVLASAVFPLSLAGQTPAAPRAGGQIPTVTLDDAIKLALKAHPDVVQAEANVDIAHANQRQAIGSWLPNVSANSSLQRNSNTRYNPSTGQTVTVGNPFAYAAGLSASLTVFDGGQRIFQGRQMSANAASSDAALVSSKFAVTLSTKQAFFNALAAVDLERVASTAVQRAEEQLKISKEKLSAGSAIRADTLQATVTLGQARLQLLNAQTQRATQEANLARLIGFDGVVAPLGDSTIVAVTGVDSTAIRAEALRGSPAVAQADAQLRAADANVNVLRTVYLPTITASYSNSRAGTGTTWTGGFDFGSLSPAWGLTLTFSWPLFNGFRRETNLATASANRDAAVAKAADARRSVNAQVTQQLAALQAARTSIQIAQASRGAAEEGLRVQRERYRLGAATIVDVLTAQQSLDQAEVDAVNARVNYQIAKSQLETLVGRQL